MGVGALATAWGLPTGPSPQSGIGNIYGTNNDGFVAFGGKHSNVVLFCFGDGSVRGLRKGFTAGAGYAAYLYASGWQDGQVVDFSTISP
jgi:hypothetical protein